MFIHLAPDVRTSFRTSAMTSVRMYAVLIASIGAAFCLACSTRDARSDSTIALPAATARPFRVALLTPGPVSDQSWNGGAYQGLLRIRDSLGAEISHVQTAAPADFEENFREYGARHFNLVFGHGFEFQDAARRVAPQFPQTIYITTSGNTAGTNLAGIAFSFSDASYLA